MLKKIWLFYSVLLSDVVEQVAKVVFRVATDNGFEQILIIEDKKKKKCRYKPLQQMNCITCPMSVVL